MKNKPATTADYQRRINTVVEYIRTHLDETLDLRTLAEVSSFSPCHFHRIVSAFLGEPPGEFIARTRIETAARLLLYSDLTVAEIAYRVGYDAPSSLTKAFGRFFGISPKEYRTAKNLPSMTKCMHSDAGIRLSKPKMLEISEAEELDSFKHLTPDMRAILTELNIADDYFKAKAQVEKLELDLEAKEREIYNLKHDLISNQVQTETNTQRIEELEAENKELLLNKTKLEAALEDSLLGKVTSAKTDKKEEKETT